MVAAFGGVDATLIDTVPLVDAALRVGLLAVPVVEEAVAEAESAVVGTLEGALDANDALAVAFGSGVIGVSPAAFVLGCAVSIAVGTLTVLLELEGVAAG